MPTYKVWLTVKDRYGQIKELDGGNIHIQQNGLSEEDLNEIKGTLPVYVPEVTNDNVLIYTLEHGETKERLEFDIDRTNDWNGLDGTNGSSYVWEPMQ